jgi:hypothetical protein
MELITSCKDCIFFKNAHGSSEWDFSTCSKQPFLDIQDGSLLPIINYETPRWCPINQTVKLKNTP